jgi:hypothetical protein
MFHEKSPPAGNADGDLRSIGAEPISGAENLRFNDPATYPQREP